MNDKQSPDALAGMLDRAPRGLRIGNRSRWVILGVVILLLAALVPFIRGGKGAGGHYVTEPAAMGNLLVTVSATGTLQPTTSIDVGSEQSGTLAKVLVQENDHVKRDQLLAQLDLAKLQDAVNKSQAALTAARALGSDR